MPPELNPGSADSQGDASKGGVTRRQSENEPEVAPDFHHRLFHDSDVEVDSNGGADEVDGGSGVDSNDIKPIPNGEGIKVNGELDVSSSTRKLSLTSSTAPQVPLVSSVQKIILYETKQRFYLIGTNNLENKYRVLKVDRTDPKELVVHDDGVTYTQKEIKQMLQMIDIGNRTKQAAQRHIAGMTKTLSAFGIVGFVKFLEGYYMILITKRRKVSLVGHHTIYKVEDVAMVYIPNESVRKHDSEEAKFVKIFQSVDLSSNFYFSYSYDLTHSLQYNMARVNVGTPTEGLGSYRARNYDYDDDDEEESALAKNGKGGERPKTNNVVVGVRTLPHYKFTWNEFLLRDFETRVHSSWVLHLIHGFVSQGDLEVFGRNIFITLIARRSKKYAGTRFLKRGANVEGDVANEVETEQIVNMADVGDWNRGTFTSFVQMRGSIPLSWSQDVRQIVPKPPISIDDMDPFCKIQGEHFNKLLSRFGSPIIVFNLIKKKERRLFESQLGVELENSIKYLNQFLPAHHQIEYIHFDMARVSRSKTAVVMDKLMEIADGCVQRTGIFQNFSDLFCHSLRPDATFESLSNADPGRSGAGRIQTGVIRTNCVDCLDRTNTAQFAIAKKALAFQLYSLGVIDTSQLEFDSDCVRMLEGLFEDHGDTLALQYGGSQLVHRIRSYRRLSPWLQSKSNDFFTNVTRYYSNAFSDADKQQAINLFLGVFQPRLLRNKFNQSATSFELDYYLHHSAPRALTPRRRFYTQWWDDDVWAALPRPLEEAKKDLDVKVALECRATDERVDSYREYYRPHELTSLDDLYCSNMINSNRDYTPSFSKNLSPFAVRAPQDKAGASENSGLKHVSTGLPASTGTMNHRPGEKLDRRSIDGSEDSSDTDTDDDLDSLSDLEFPLLKAAPIVSDTLAMDSWNAWKDVYVIVREACLHLGKKVTMPEIFPSMKDVYGCVIVDPKANDINMYKEFTTIGLNAGCGAASSAASAATSVAAAAPDEPAVVPVKEKTSPSSTTSNSTEEMTPKSRLPTPTEMMASTTTLIQRSVFSLDNSRQVMPPTVKRSNRDVYEQYVHRAKGPQEPSASSMKKYQDFVGMLYQ